MRPSYRKSSLDLLRRAQCGRCGTSVAKACLHNGRCAECADHHNLSTREYAGLSTEQDNKCAICRTESYLVADHDHVTGFNRGLLCRNCNAGLGMFNDDFALFEKAVAYLLKHRELQFASALAEFSKFPNPLLDLKPAKSTDAQ